MSSGFFFFFWGGGGGVVLVEVEKIFLYFIALDTHFILPLPHQSLSLAHFHSLIPVPWFSHPFRPWVRRCEEQSRGTSKEVIYEPLQIHLRKMGVRGTHTHTHTHSSDSRRGERLAQINMRGWIFILELWQPVMTRAQLKLFGRVKGIWDSHDLTEKYILPEASCPFTRMHIKCNFQKQVMVS